MERFKYTAEKVVDVIGPEFSRRNFVEQQCLMDAIQNVFGDTQFMACEVGAGYGRMTQCLEHLGIGTCAFEREQELVDLGKKFLVHTDFIKVDNLGTLPSLSDYFDLVLTWTCLQHLHNDELASAISEIKRIVKVQGYVFICEETDPEMNDLRHGNKAVHGTQGLPMGFYENLMGKNFAKIRSLKRPVEETYPRFANSGTLMIFKRII